MSASAVLHCSAAEHPIEVFWYRIESRVSSTDSTLNWGQPTLPSNWLRLCLSSAKEWEGRKTGWELDGAWSGDDDDSNDDAVGMGENEEEEGVPRETWWVLSPQSSFSPAVVT